MGVAHLSIAILVGDIHVHDGGAYATLRIDNDSSCQPVDGSGPHHTVADEDHRDHDVANLCKIHEWMDEG